MGRNRAELFPPYKFYETGGRQLVRGDRAARFPYYAIANPGWMFPRILVWYPRTQRMQEMPLDEVSRQKGRVWSLPEPQRLDVDKADGGHCDGDSTWIPVRATPMWTRCPNPCCVGETIISCISGFDGKISFSRVDSGRCRNGRTIDGVPGHKADPDFPRM